uniref:Activator of Hsp90 ATPase AHSA1-like N-terminal domain-containing protein n=1 Tax=Anabas testudineus TaxID=64144 RepID=A0A3Q1HW25_ANATE
MAKWGEGDPRWIVEERADAKNVNNWHWTERDVSSWSSSRLRQLLLEVRVEGAEGVCQVTDVDKLEGEASINNRKGKLIFFYEWQLRAGWLGVSSSGVKYRGTVDVSNLSDKNNLDDLDISVSLCKDQPNTPLLNVMRRTGVQKVRRVLGEYIHQLKSGLLPTVQNLVSNRTRLKVMSPPLRSFSSTSPSNTGVRIPTCSFNLMETFQTSADELYRTFINQEFVQVFMRSAAVVDASQNPVRFYHIVPDQKIEMRWRFMTWPSEHYATVTLDLKDRGDETELKLECRGVPTGEEDSTREGWTRFYFQAIKQTFGY